MDLKTIKECVAQAAELEGISDSARLDSELLISHVINKDRTYCYTWPEYQLSEHELAAYQALFSRRLGGEPIAHLIGKRDFWSLSLAVNASTLIPRPETELLVELALWQFEKDPMPKTVLDLGTGTGAIALAIASERPDWSVVGLEKSPDALALAHYNQQQHAIDNVHFELSDWFSALESSKTQFDMILANPPYIDENDRHLLEGDVRFEPRSALVAQESGLQDIRHIIKEAPFFLKNKAVLLIEHGYQQGQAVRQLFSEASYIECFTWNDIAGQPRVTGARLNGV